MICFEILMIFGKKNRKRAKLEIELLRRSVGNPRCGVDLRRSVGCLATARPRGQNPPPPPSRVRHDLALLRCSLAMLCRGINIVHNEKISDFCF